MTCTVVLTMCEPGGASDARPGFNREWTRIATNQIGYFLSPSGLGTFARTFPILVGISPDGEP